MAHRSTSERAAEVAARVGIAGPVGRALNDDYILHLLALIEALAARIEGLESA